MFQFRRFPTYAYFVQRRLTEYCSAGFPHSEICGSMLMCSSPQLIAACHVLHRLLMPRHSPCALSSLTSGSQELCRLQIRFIVVLCYPSFKSPQITLLPLCCLLAISCLLHCSVFKVQTSNLFQGQIEMLRLSAKHFDLILPGGDKRNRTAGLLLARQALSQLSYTPSSSRTSHPSLLPSGKSSLAPSLLLFKSNPLCWASI